MPPKSRPIADDLIEALQDKKVAEALAKALSPLIDLSIEEAIGKRLEGLVTSVRELKGEIGRLHKRCEDAEKENAELKKTMSSQDRRLDDMESYSRCDNIIIRGLPERSSAERATAATSLDARPSAQESSEAVESTVVAFVNDSLGVEISPSDISIAHRIKAGPKDTTRPVIVRFTSRKARNAVYNARKSLKDTGHKVFLSEHLTKATSDLFFEARKLLREKKFLRLGPRGAKSMSNLAPTPLPEQRL